MPGLRAETLGDGAIEIGDNTVIGQSFHVTAMGRLRIGQGTLITGFVSVTDIDHEYIDVSRPVHEQPYLYSRTEIGANCFLGMGARIQAGTVLGEGCIVGANAVVRGTFPAHSVIVGAPGRIVKKYNPDTASWEKY
jgi:acetyltransferase-like isoleucine patch superfamily enzyme